MRKPYNFRLAESGHTWLKDRAAPYGLTAADVLRASIALAMANPKLLDAELRKIKDTL